jgi:hypothetical protein
MSAIGSPIETSLLQAAQAQQTASKTRDKEKATETARRFQDVVELRVAGVETSDAIRKLPSNDSEQAEEEHHAHPGMQRKQPREGENSIDVTA